jgi:hypothetical protein
VQQHLLLLGILHLVWGAIGLLLGVSTLLLAAAAIAIGVSSEAERWSAVVTALMFGLCATALLAGGSANAWAGSALRRRLPRGRFATLGLAVPNLFVLPFGTALGIYAFWVLLHEETKRQFTDTNVVHGGRAAHDSR